MSHKGLLSCLYTKRCPKVPCNPKVPRLVLPGILVLLRTHVIVPSCPKPWRAKTCGTRHVLGGVASLTGPQSADPFDDLGLSPFPVILFVHSSAVPYTLRFVTVTSIRR
jgi:hypothetical protein